MRLTKFAQSTIFLRTNAGTTMLIDPGKYNLEPGRFTLESFPTADIVIITHKHADHFDIDLVKAILSRSQPLILTNPEIHDILKTHNIESRILTDGTHLREKDFSLTAIPTDHVVRGEAIVNFGLVIHADNTSLYHTSDTRFIDPSLLPPETKTKYLLVPISNRGVAMGIDDALVFMTDLKPQITVPIHYDSPKDVGRVDPNEFVSKATKLGLHTKLLAFGEELTL